MLATGPERRADERPATFGARTAHLRPRLRLVRKMAVAFLAVAASQGDLGTGRRVPWAMAQQQGQPATIKVAAVTQAKPASKVKLQIQVGPQDAIAKNSFVRIRGLPATVALSEGYAIAPGAWAVPLTGLSNLVIVLPVGVEGSSEVAISLVTMEGAVLAQAKTTLVVAPARASPQATGSAGPAVPKLSGADRQRALALHAKGLEQLALGNVYAARKFFEHAAEAGLAQSAMAAAGTYDPVELAKLNVVGLQPDVEAARKWYEKARELGAIEASERIQRLGAR
jgi:hypothetical protein